MGNNQFCTQRDTLYKKQTIKQYDTDTYQLTQIVEKGNESFQQHDYNQALEYYYEALKGFKIAYDIKHPTIAMTLNNIALVYKQQQDYSNALKIYNEALYIYTDQHITEMNHEKFEYNFQIGKQYWTYINSIEQSQLSHLKFQISLFYIKKIRKLSKFRIYNNLGLAYMNLKDYQKSYKYFQQCIDKDIKYEISIQRSCLDIEENEIIQSDIFNNLGIVCQKLKKLDESTKFYLKSLEIYQQQQNMVSVAKVLNNMVSVYQENNNIDKAYQSAFKSIKIRLNYLGEGCIETFESYKNLATLYEFQEEYEEALKTYEIIKNLRLQYFPFDSIQLAKTLSSIALIHLYQNNFKLALEIQLQALDLRQQKVEKQDLFDLAENVFNIGFIYKNLKDFQTSNDYFQQALNILNQNEEQNQDHIINILKNESQNHQILGNKQESLRCLNKCLEYLESSSEKYKEIMEDIIFLQDYVTL